MSAEDFSEDITNGGFGAEQNHGDEEMTVNANSGNNEELSSEIMNQEDGNSGGGESNNKDNGATEEMDHSQDTGSADQYGKDDDRKLFIGGLSWESTEKDLREYFTKYGAIESLTLKMDPTTGRSRGFAFIVFSEVSTLDKVVAAGEHVINGKKVDPKKAKARHGKIFVGGLTQEISDDDIKNFFTQFGNIVEVEMPIDKTKNQRKGFCFITFDNEQIVHELLKTPKQTIGGKEVDVKKAQPPQAPRGMGGPPWGGMAGVPVGRGRSGSSRGTRGRGRGDYWGGSPYSAAAAYPGAGYSNYGAYGADYYGSGYYGGGYDYYGSGYDYGYDYDTPHFRGGGRGTAGGRGSGGGFGASKQRGAQRQQRHMPY